MMYYRVTTKFYDDGKVDVLVDTVYKKEQPKNFSCEFKEYDLYCDFFDSWSDAAKFAEQAKKS